jgi:hypothetical protein
VDAIEQREGLLSRAITFFRSAHTVSWSTGLLIWDGLVK